MKMKMAGIVLLTLLVAMPAFAHVTVAPQQSEAGGSQVYKVRVHNDEKVETKSIQLQIPDDVTVVSVEPVTDGTFETGKAASRITAITWYVKVQPSKYVELAFTVKNPDRTKALHWNIREELADGAINEWNDKPGAEGKASITKLSAPSSMPMAMPAK
jgi:uncharacterized protein YcnI